ncbi:hypothetical protein Sjap_024211 [Stephania japonica]|uniref:FAD-binding PCMH-type domain-containing protein n=1 Tax=Stephania japonica TaxID=461633 RepID=A0AAP0HLA2_9MAGN
MAITSITSSALVLLSLFHILIVLFSVTSSASYSSNAHDQYAAFFNCLAKSNHAHIPIYLPNTSSYNSTLISSIVNTRFLTPEARKPHLIIKPLNESQVQAVVICSRKHEFQIRALSGGHDYEGIAYTSHQQLPFIMLDLINFHSIKVDIKSETAWVQSAATLGQLFYNIAAKSPIHAFPAGLGPPVGVGGHFSGGGYGNLIRKYGLAADNIIDAQIVNANGEILDRRAMGEDLFWAIRGGGAASFGVVLSWKIKLVRVPPTVTVFTVTITLEQGAIPLLHKWQYIAHKLPKDLSIMPAYIGKTNSTKQLLFVFCLFLGKAEELLQIMQESFPEFGLKREDCIETTWVRSTLYFFRVPYNESLCSLLDRNPIPKYPFKSISDYVEKPIPESALQELWGKVSEVDYSYITFIPYGGRMSEIAESEIPFPHREGNIYFISYEVDWMKPEESTKKIEWIRSLYKYMTPYVSKNPRAAYINYRDLDLGQNSRVDGSASYEEAKVWGVKYFKGNFDRLVKVKSEVDPTNFFTNEQSIPVAHNQLPFNQSTHDQILCDPPTDPRQLQRADAVDAVDAMCYA